MNKIKYYLGAIAAILLLTGSAQIVLAAAGDEGGVNGGGCAPDGYTGTYWDTCFGATWRYYYTTEDSVRIDGTSSGTVTGGTVKGCGQYGGYYRLALEKYNAGTNTSLGTQIGLLQNNKLRAYGGITTFRIESGSISLDEAKAKFDVALANGATNGFSWTDVSWFCYDDSWDEPDPPEPPENIPGSGDAHFYTTSSVEIPAQNDVSHHQLTSSEDGSVTIKLSTDQPSITVNFWHNIYYVNDTSYNPEDRFDTVSTTWTISGHTGNNGLSRSFSVNGKYNTSQEVARENSVVINLNEGQTKTVCSDINYNPKYVSYWIEDVGEWVPVYFMGFIVDWEWDHWYYYYHYNGSSGANGSSACVTVTRPSNPSGPGPDNPSGTTSSDVLFAGEEGVVGWNASANAVDVRRNSAYQAIVYLVPAYENYYNGITQGEARYRGGDTCTYYEGKSDTDYCEPLHEKTYNPSLTSSSSITHRDTVTIPDTVGYKYCNAFGYQYQYWYAYNYGGGDEWHHESSRDYWYVYDSSCRPIAKKPSLSTWNNSILSNGGVITSTSPRYNPATMGTLATGRRTLYGSWTEYLNVIGGSVSGLTSGAALAIGSSSLDVLMNSPLTITNNTSTLGYSGVQSSTSLRTRLDTYLKNQSTTTDPGENIGGAGWTNIADTRVYYRRGNLNITDNITLSSGAYASIYQLPQVIIFVDGDVNISSRVTQIDAWIIASDSSTINTCSDFQTRITEADAIGRSSNTCTNQLVFNGPVMAGKLILNRSFGSDPLVSRTGTFGAPSTRQASAEVFNYRADAYLWAYAQAGRYDSSYTETYTRELAPRY